MSLQPVYVAPGRHNLQEVADSPRDSPRAGCVHLGPPTGDHRDCVACGGAKSVPLHACAVHGRCTTDRHLVYRDGGHNVAVAWCRTCPDRNVRPKLALPDSGDLAILITGGIGDAFALEGLLRPEDRERLTAIYYACPARAEISQLFKTLPNFPRLARHEMLPAPGVYYTRAAVEEAIARPLPPEVEDWSIAAIFGQGRPYAGSSLLSHTLAEAPRIDGAYAVVVPWSRGFGRWGGRDFDAADWQACTAALERHHLHGVILSATDDTIPDHPRLIDLQGETTLLESIELLKGAATFMGVDSCLSVLAAKLLPAERLAVKSVWAHCYQWAHVYYAPWRTFPFLGRQLRELRWT